MTMQSIFFKEYDGIHVQNPINGGVLSTSMPRWSGLRSYGGEAIVQSKLTTQDLSTGGDQFSSGAKELNQHKQGLGKGNATQFTIFSGDRKTAENGVKTQLQMASPIHDVAVEHQGTFKLGYDQPLVCTKYPYAEQYYGVYPTSCGTQIAGRIMLPLSMTTDGGPIFVNPKQYNGIMRRRKKRAEQEALENKVAKLRKPYLHLSRHLHAMRRPRGNGGRFLNKKKSSDISEESAAKRSNKEEKQLPQQTESQISEVLQSDAATNPKGTNGSRSTSPGSEVTSHVFSRATTLHPFQFNHLHPGFQHFPHDVANTELGIAMAGSNYLKF